MIILRNSYYSSPYYGGYSDLEERLFIRVGKRQAEKFINEMFVPAEKKAEENLNFGARAFLKKFKGDALNTNKLSRGKEAKRLWQERSEILNRARENGQLIEGNGINYLHPNVAREYEQALNTPRKVYALPTDAGRESLNRADAMKFTPEHVTGAIDKETFELLAGKGYEPFVKNLNNPHIIYTHHPGSKLLT